MVCNDASTLCKTSAALLARACLPLAQAIADGVAAITPDTTFLSIPATATAARSGVFAAIILVVVVPLTLWRFNAVGRCLGTELSAARNDQVGSTHAFLCEVRSCI